MPFSRNSRHRCAQRGGGCCGYSLLMTPLARIIMMITITIVVISGFKARAAGGGGAGEGGGVGLQSSPASPQWPPRSVLCMGVRGWKK